MICSMLFYTQLGRPMDAIDLDELTVVKEEGERKKHSMTEDMPCNPP